MFDLNPLAKTGIFTDDLKFAHLFILYLLSFPDFEFTPSLQKTAVKNHKTASEYDIENMIINGYPAVEASLGILDDMSYFYKDFKEASYIISMQKDKIIYNKRYCVRIYEQYKKGDENNVRNVWNKFQQGNKCRRISV
jgi:glutamate--cysteine ligase